jgi:hypothetical protein
MNNTTYDLTYFFSTKSQANNFISQIGLIAENAYHTDFNLEKMLLEQFGIQKKDKFMTFLREQKVNTESPGVLKDFLTKIITYINSLPVLSMTLAFEPNEQTLHAISGWFLMQINKQVILDLTIDRSLIAGAAINYNGKYFDMSIKEKFKKISKEILDSQITDNGHKNSTDTESKHNIDSISVGR